MGVFSPYIVVEMGFGSTWTTLDSAITWTDVSDYLVNNDLSVFRGATAAHGRSGAGTIDLVLEDRERIFDPLHASGPHYGDLLPGVPVRVMANVGAAELLDEFGDPILDEFGDPIITVTTTLPVARGFVSGFPQESTGGGDALTRVPIFAVDGFQNLSRAPAPRSALSAAIGVTSPTAYYLLDAPSGARGVPDIADGKYDGTPFDEPTFGGDALADGLLSSTLFDGVDDRIDLGRTRIITGPTTGCVVAVFRTATPAASGSFRPIYFQSDGNSPSQQFTVNLFVDTAGMLHFDIFQSPVANSYQYPTAVTDGETHLVIAQRSTTAGSGIAIDSSTLDATAGTPSYGVGTGSAIAGIPGSAAGFSSDVFGGSLCDVAVLNRGLTLAERDALVEAFQAYDGDTTGARLTRILDHVGWPSDLRAIATGKSQLGPATFEADDNALAYSQLIERTEDGRMFVDASGQLTFRDRYWPFTSTEGGTSQFTFTDDAVGAGYAEFNWDLDDELVINSPRYSRRGGGEVRLDDAASQALYGIREDQQSDLLLGTDAEVRGRAYWTLTTRKDAKPRVKRILIPLHAYSEADQQSVLELELGYRITAERTPQGVGSAISREFHVDGIRHQVSVGEWWCELYVSPAVDQDLTLFTLSTSTLGGTHVLAH